MGHRTQAECGQHKARDQELTSSVVLSPTTARERKGREGFVPSPNTLSQAKDISWPVLSAQRSPTVTSQPATPADPPALAREPPHHHGLGSRGLRRQTPRGTQLTLTARLRPGGRPLAPIRTPGGGRRRLGSPPRRRPPPGHPPRCGIAGTLPWRPRRASPRPVPAVGGISSIFPPPFLFLCLSFPHSRTTPEPKSLPSAGKKEQRVERRLRGRPGRSHPLVPARRGGRSPTAAERRSARLGSPGTARTLGRARHARLARHLPAHPARCSPVCAGRVGAQPARSAPPAPYLRGGARGAADTPPPRAGMTLRRNPSFGQENKPFLGVCGGGRSAAGRESGRRAPLGRPFPPRGQDGGDPCRHRRGARAARPAQAPPPPAELRLWPLPAAAPGRLGGRERRGCGAGPGSPAAAAERGSSRAPPAGSERSSSPGALAPQPAPSPPEAQGADTYLLAGRHFPLAPAPPRAFPGSYSAGAGGSCPPSGLSKGPWQPVESPGLALYCRLCQPASHPLLTQNWALSCFTAAELGPDTSNPPAPSTCASHACVRGGGVRAARQLRSPLLAGWWHRLARGIAAHANALQLLSGLQFGLLFLIGRFGFLCEALPCLPGEKKNSRVKRKRGFGLEVLIIRKSLI